MGAAAGPNRLVVVTNVDIGIYSKADCSVLSQRFLTTVDSRNSVRTRSVSVFRSVEECEGDVLVILPAMAGGTLWP
jgi:hypothetical protein